MPSGSAVAGKASAKAGGYIAKRVARLFRDGRGVLRDSRGRFAKDVWKKEREALPDAKTLMQRGREHKGTGHGRHKNSFPTKANADDVLYRTDPVTGQINYYAVYDHNGTMLKRVDMVGPPHGDVPTPHVVNYYHDVNPHRPGHVYPRRDLDAYPIHPREIP